jgi:hypothetical protein
MKKELFLSIPVFILLFINTGCKRMGSNDQKQPELQHHKKLPGTFIKAEKLNFTLSGLTARIEDLSKYDKEGSGSNQLLVESQENSTFSFTLNSLIEKGYSIELYYTKGPDYGNAGIYIGNTKYGEIRGYNPVILPRCKITLPDIPNPFYRLKLRFSIEGKDGNSKGFSTGLEGIDLIPVRNYIMEWNLIGPFANMRDSHNNLMGFDSVYPPEEAVDLKGKYWGAGGQLLSWKHVKTPWNGFFSLRNILKSNELIVGYAVTYIFSVENTNCVLFVGSDESMKIFFNNQLVYQYTGIRQAEPDQAMMILHIKRGWNKLLLKVEANHEGNGFYARVLDPDNMIFISSDQKNPLRAKK